MSDLMRNVLIIAYYFPPLGGVASLRMSRFATQLPDNGWRVTVLAPANGAYYLDPDLSFPEDQVLRSRSFELSRVGKKVLRTGGSDTRPARPSGVRRRIQAAARRLLYFPDGQIGWYWPAVQVGRAAMRKNSYDVIFSSAYPMTAHLIARRLHRDSGIPWVAEYRDPVDQLIGGGLLNRRRALRLVRSIASESSALVMTSPGLLSQSEIRDRPLTVITNGCDGPIPAGPGSPGQFTLAHLGTLYPKWQNLAGAWQAIGNLAKAGGPIVDRLCFIGDPSAEVRTELDAYALPSNVEITGLLSRGEAIDRLRNADALLMAGPEDAGETLRGWSSGKVFEYLATDLPIVYVGDRECYAADLLRQHPGCYVLDSHDVDGIMAALSDCRNQRHVRDISSFTRPVLTGKLAAVLNDAVAEV